jgi:hypothetical protein
MNEAQVGEVRPVRVQLSRRKGWRMPPNTMKVDRSTGFGNPFPIAKGTSTTMGVTSETWQVGTWTGPVVQGLKSPGHRPIG